MTDSVQRPNQPLRPHRRRRPSPAAGGPNWPSFRGTATLVGTSTSGVSVYVDAAIGTDGQTNAQDLLSAADRIVAQNNAIFNTAGAPVDVVIFALHGATDGTGGADHGGCDYASGNAIEVDAAFGQPDRVIALFEAELSECAMNGRLCGLSTGEALSRWCAAVVGNNALADFATAPTWDADGRPNWVDRTAPTDQDADSTGCGMAFLSWLLSQGQALPAIAQQLVALGDNGTLADLYAQLTGQPANNAWQAFNAALDNLATPISDDDPFRGLSQAAVPTS